MSKTITLQVPETIYQRLVNTARATNRPLEDIVLRVLEVSSPPNWTDVPEAFQKDLAALDSLDNDALWQFVIRISDNKSGIKETVKTRIFDPFFTTKPVGNSRGLGLSIAHQIVVNQHSGELECISQPDVGTEMIIKLPFKKCLLN